jgi:2-pyrone-4,6-dicarboxylate lactonase
MAPEASFLHSPSAPKAALPKGSWDTHCHVFGPQARFAFAPNRKFTPGDAPKEALFALHRTLGITRCVIVQSGVHGLDNAAVINALLAKGGAYRGIALLPLDVGDREIRHLAAVGFCGVRFNFMRHLGEAPPIDDVIRFAHRLADHGWHLQLHFDPSLLADMAPALRRSPVTVVIDHMARVDAALGLEQPHFRQLLALMEDRRFWVKVSGCERISRRPPPYEDAWPFARKLVSEFGDRVLWGTDWPHPNVPPPTPDDGVLADILAEIAPGAQERQALLVDNPERLYGPATI